MAEGGGPTILVVEDDGPLRRLLTRMLESGGYTAVSAGNASDGLTIVQDRAGALDLAIIDMMMPVMSGLDLATELLRQYPQLRLLYISGYVDSVAAKVISRCTPEQVLLKPFTEEVLLARVELLIGSGPRPQPATESGVADKSLRKCTLG